MSIFAPCAAAAISLTFVALAAPGRASGEETRATSKVSATAAAKPRPKPITSRERAAARRDGRYAAKAKGLEERAAWLARLQERGIEAWPENETVDEHAAALVNSREMVDEVVDLFPGTQLHETEHFLFVSNIPPQQIGPYVTSLDRMYDWMCRLYGVPREHQVWLGGKAPIFAFLDKAEFDAFEDRFYPEARDVLRTMTSVYGLSHLKPTGEVVIACYRGNDPNDFGQMLVHETSHGFIHRYKTKARLPNWVDEGMADLVGAEMVPASTAVRTREVQAIHQLVRNPTLRGMLTAERIDTGHYGLASNLNRFLLQSSRVNYVRFIEALKEGRQWEDALGDAYASTPEQLLAAYARWLKVRHVQP